MNENLNISKLLFEWYTLNKRDLPWRSTKDPYKIWISEIILQQTRINQGIHYYRRFTERFPDIFSLAVATEQEVLKYWEGLGYYSRARNLHATAQFIKENYNGIFPKDYTSLLKLKGIGEYTAAAIASFAWNLPYPAIDGNVFRFLSRLFAISEPINTSTGKKYFMNQAWKLINPHQPGLFNQATMEFGALQCVPSSPDCSICPFNSICLAHLTDSVAQFPVKKRELKIKELHLSYFHIFDEEHLLIYKRGKGIWENLFEFPVIESEHPLSFDQLIQHPLFKNIFPDNKSLDFKCIIEKKKHILSHRILYATFYQVYIKNGIKSSESFIKIKTDNVVQYPFHRLMKHYLDQEIEK